MITFCRNFKYYTLILIVLLLQNCTGGGTVVWKDNDINPTVRNEIKQQNNKLFNAIKEDDTRAVRAMMSDSLLRVISVTDLDELFAKANSNFNFDTYRILDEYYVENTTTGTTNVIHPSLSSNDYLINYNTLNKKAYVSVLIPNSLINKIIVLVIYGKYGSEWKINALVFRQYTLYEKTFTDYYNLAKDSYDKGYLIDAFLYLSIAMKLSEPSQFIEDGKGDEVRNFYNKVETEVNAKYKMPVVLDKLETKPEVFYIYPQDMEEGFFPMVQYLSDVNIEDVAALRAENLTIRAIIGEYFEGIDKDKKYVFYRAYNEMPGEETVERYGFIDTVSVKVQKH